MKLYLPQEEPLESESGMTFGHPTANKMMKPPAHSKCQVGLKNPIKSKSLKNYTSMKKRSKKTAGKETMEDFIFLSLQYKEWAKKKKNPLHFPHVYPH